MKTVVSLLWPINLDVHAAIAALCATIMSNIMMPRHRMILWLSRTILTVSISYLEHLPDPCNLLCYLNFVTGLQVNSGRMFSVIFFLVL